MIRKGSVEMDMKQLGQYKEGNLFLRGMVPLIGYKTATDDICTKGKTGRRK